MLPLLYALLATAKSSLKPRRELALDKNAPDLRQRESPDGGKVIALPMVGGLHHRYARREARAKVSAPHDVGREHELRALREAKAHAEPSATHVRV